MAGICGPESRRFLGATLVAFAVALSVAAPASASHHRRNHVYRVYHTCANGGCGLHVRTGPGYSAFASVGLLHDGDKVHVVCQATGEPVSGLNGTSSNVWDKLPNGRWVADYYVDTPGTEGAFSPPIPRCGAGHPQITTPCNATSTRPQELVLFCNTSVSDHLEYMNGIHWSSWGGSKAHGTGTLYVQSCSPSCENGNLNQYHAHVVLGHPRYCSIWRINEYTSGFISTSQPGLHKVRLDPRCDVEELPTLSYLRQDSHYETLQPWQGGHVAVLTEPGVARSAAAMTRLVSALDRAFAYYTDVAGQTPLVPADDAFFTLNGRDDVAEVSRVNCGIACSYIGADGTELLAPLFEHGYDEVAQSNLYDQAPFYELGRSFWFWSPQLAFKGPSGAVAGSDPVITGYAVLMRFESMAAAGVSGSPEYFPNGPPPSFATLQSEVTGLAGYYEANPSLTFAGTLAQGKAPGSFVCGTTYCGGTDFWASLMMQLASRHGGDAFLSRFFRAASGLPPATTTVAAVTNWERAASDAACTDLSSVFYTRWGFPRPDGSVTARPPSSTVPEPAGSCGTG